MRYYCSQECHDKDQAYHRNECIPSIPLEGAISIKSRVYYDAVHQEFEQNFLLERGRVKQPPAVLSSREVTIDPRSFVTVRVTIDGRKHTALYVSTDLDIRWRVTDSDGSWYPPGTLMLEPHEKNSVVLIAPGKSMVTNLEIRRAAAKQETPRSIDVPDEELIEFAQAIPSEYNKEKRQGLVHIVEWHEHGSLIREDAIVV